MIRSESQIVQHIKSAPFLNPVMIARQWGIDLADARKLYAEHYDPNRKPAGRVHRCKPSPRKHITTQPKEQNQ